MFDSIGRNSRLSKFLGEKAHSKKKRVKCCHYKKSKNICTLESELQIFTLFFLMRLHSFEIRVIPSAKERNLSPVLE